MKNMKKWYRKKLSRVWHDCKTIAWRSIILWWPGLV